MASIKELRLKIRSLKNTNKITAAMKLVATSKLRRAQEASKANTPYALKMQEILGRVAGSITSHPALEQRALKKVRFYVFSSDKGLCGGFNNTLFKYLNGFIRDLQTQSGTTSKIDFETYAIGRKASEYTSRRPVFGYARTVDSMAKEVDLALIDTLMDEALKDFLSGKIDAVYLVFNHYETVLKQTPSNLLVLPISKAKTDVQVKSGVEAEYIFEPSQEEVLELLIPKFLSAQYFQALLESQVGEFSARMTAMDAATKNSKELIRKKTLVMNRLRQAAITTELTEIVSGAESLKD